MLSTYENEILTQTGPGTPMGDLFRRFWIPVALAEELPGPDCPPIRLKVLSENLVAFRDTNGNVGLIDNFCPHRRASLFFGRNEECGLRCVYHGWKFDIDGDCVDMPSEPAESNFKNKVKIKDKCTSMITIECFFVTYSRGLRPPPKRGRRPSAASLFWVYI